MKNSFKRCLSPLCCNVIIFYALSAGFLHAELELGSNDLGPVVVVEPVATLVDPQPFTPPGPKQRPRANFQVTSEKAVEHASSIVTYKRANPPAVLPQRQAEPPITPSPAELQASYEYWTSKPHYVTGLSVVVYDGDFSEVSWRHDGRLYRIYSEIDFGLFRSMSRFETQDALYTNTMGYEEVDTQGRRDLQLKLQDAGVSEMLIPVVPERPDFTRPESEYIIIEGRDAFPGEADPFALMDWLHLYYDSHESELRDVRRRQVEYNEAYRKWRRANPSPERLEITLTYWPGENSAYLSKESE